MGQSPSSSKAPESRDSNGPIHPSKALDDNISSDTSDVNSPNSKFHNPNLSAFRQTPPTDEESEAARQALERVRANTRRRSSDYDPTKDPLRAIPKDNQVEYSVGNAVKMIQLEEFKSLHEKPCVRNGLLTGIGTGAAVGGMAGVLGRGLWKSCNWAVAGFAFTSWAAYEYCQAQRRQEKDGMKRAVEVMDRARFEKAQKKEAERKKRRAEKEEQDRLEEERKRMEEEARKKWYGLKFW